jgi:hypothetical protein
MAAEWPSDIAGTAAADVAVEKARAEAVEAANAAAIAAETTRAQNAEATKATMSALTAEATARASGDALLIPLAQRGANNGVGTLDGEGHQSLAQVPPSVVSSSTESLGEIEGSLTPAIPSGYRESIFAAIAKGAVAVHAPTGAPAGTSRVTVEITQDSTGGHAITTPGTPNTNSEPVYNTAPNAVNTINFVTFNGGTNWFVEGPLEGKAGATGATGPEGFNPSKLLLPSAWPVYLGTGASTTENKPVKAETFPRHEANTTLTLTSGTPVICAIPVPAKTVIAGAVWGIKTVEGTAANRTHLWAVLLDSSGKVLRHSADYTSSTNSPMASGTRRGVLFTETYETGEATTLYVALCEVMSSTNPMTLAQKSGETVLTEAAPMTVATGPAGQTTPPEVGATLAFTGTANEPWVGLV